VIRPLVLVPGALVALVLAARAQTSAELAGNSLAQFPFFEHVRAFHEGAPLQLAVDPGTHPALVGQTADLYVVASKTVAGWASDATLVDLTSAVEIVTFVAGTIQANTFTVDGGTLSGNAGIELGVAYDVVIDVDQDGLLGPGDVIDGLSDQEAGAYVVRDTSAPGPLSTVELTYDLSAAAWDEQNTFYPANVASLGKLPLIVVSHGNGHNYQWYEHIGNHMASYGYVVMSHANNTGPGTQFAATTTLSNTDAFLGSLGSIAGGVLQGHVDDSKIIWIGHSRGGEGVVIAYDRIFDGTHVPVHYTLDDIKLVSSIAPVDYQHLPDTDPHSVNYHLWTGGADADVDGCADDDVRQTFQIHDRAQQFRQSISLHGAGHGDFHNGSGSSVAAGPCLVGRANTHAIMRGYLFPLAERYVDGNVPAKDFLWRQWESFRPPGAPTSSCVVVDLMYRDGTVPGRLVIDDFQSNPSPAVSSSGIKIASTVSPLLEGPFDDPDAEFTTSPGFGEPMNGFTLDGEGADDSRGVVFQWNGTYAYFAYIVPGGGPLSLWKTISLRAAQAPRDALTTAALGDLTFDVTVLDKFGAFSRINVSAFGGGIEEPYQRTTCGTGAGWAAEFETIRIPIAAFAYNGSGVDLSKIFAIGFEFGPSHGSAQGALGLDQVELLLD
jgi:hypothetical protein